MKDRNKRTLVIGILCCLLVFMGVGFAVTNATLNINGTATAINTWDVRMTNIEVIEKSEGATNEEEPKINEDGISANFNTDFTKPGDFITYKVTIENKGSIDAVLNDISITLNVSEADKDLFNITDTRPNNQLLEAGTSTTFTLKVEFRSDADRMPSGDIEYIVKVDYSQETGEIGGEGETEEDWTFKVDESGTIVAYNYEKGTDVVIPAEVDGIPVKRIDKNSFLKFNVAMFMDESEGTGGFIIYDLKNYDSIVNKIEEFLDTMGSEYSMLKNYYKVGEFVIPEGIELSRYNVDINNTEGEILKEATVELKKLNLSKAVYLEKIDDSAFSKYDFEKSQVQVLEEVIFGDNNSLTYIGPYAFIKNNLKVLNLPSSVQTIGAAAFASNEINGKLTIPSNVTEVNQSAFSANHITELQVLGNVTKIGILAFSYNEISNIVVPASVILIGDDAFANQRNSDNNPTLQSIIIKRTEEDFLANVTVGTYWYDNSLNPTITYDPS